MNKLFLISTIVCILRGTKALRCYDCYDIKFRSTLGSSEDWDLKCDTYDIVTCTEGSICVAQHSAYTSVSPSGVTDSTDIVARNCVSSLATHWTQEPYCEKQEADLRHSNNGITEFKCDVSACSTDECNK